MKDMAKIMFAQAFATLLNKNNFDQITVKNLADVCQAGRQTFYNHFKDKFDLAAWIYNKLEIQYLHTAEAAPYPVDAFYFRLSAMCAEHASYFSHAQHFPEGISLFTFLEKQCLAYFTQFIQHHHLQKGPDIVFAISYTAGAVAHTLLQSVCLSKDPFHPQTIADSLSANLPPALILA